jgi:glutathione S-transferase
VPATVVLFFVRRRITRRYRSAGYGPNSLTHLQERMAENLAYLRDLLEDKSFLLGRYVTLADLSVFSQLRWMSRYEEKRLLDAVPTVRKWMDQIEAVPEIQHAINGVPPVAIDDRFDGDAVASL